MSRNASGTYTLPAGNPVSGGQTISSAWANNTLNDIASALTDSLDRTGKGAMTGVLKITDGGVAAPGLAFDSANSTGVYWAAAGSGDIAAGMAISAANLEMVRFINGATHDFLWMAQLKIGVPSTGSTGGSNFTFQGVQHSGIPAASPTIVDFIPGAGTFELNLYGGAKAGPTSLLRVRGSTTQHRIASVAVGAGSAAPIDVLIGANTASTQWHTNGDVSLGKEGFFTNTAEGFPYIPGASGAPTGLPTDRSVQGMYPLYIDTANLRLYIRISGVWRYATLT